MKEKELTCLVSEEISNRFVEAIKCLNPAPIIINLQRILIGVK